MKTRSKTKMEEIIRYVEQYYMTCAASPSTTKIAEKIGVSRGTAYKYLVEMAERGLIGYDGKTIMTSRMRHMNTDRLNVPIVGAVRCGSPEEEHEEINEYVSLPASLFGYGDYFILCAKGDSMNLAGIDEGDYVVVERRTEAKAGDIVAVLDEDNCSTLKRLGYDSIRGRYYLKAESSNPVNKNLYPQEIVIQGIARNIIKKI